MEFLWPFWSIPVLIFIPIKRGRFFRSFGRVYDISQDQPLRKTVRIGSTLETSGFSLLLNAHFEKDKISKTQSIIRVAQYLLIFYNICQN